MSNEMNNERLIILRRHQFILQNITMLIILIIILVLSMLDITMKQFYIGTTILFLIQFILYLVYGKTDVVVHTKKMKELHEYEESKLGKEAKKQRKFVIGTNLFAIVCFVFIAIITPSEKIFFNELTFSSAPQFGIFFFLIFWMILINIITFFRNKAFDRSKNLEGFTMKMFLSSLFLSLILFGVVVVCSILFIIY
ncbi:hypothetical protein [Chengkuizengella axinellae]|uniref:Uncharacterized protein n=1 Tax=Chengkuizengella axinellae TaxID=3064388 RepID=A0ABT9J487_9BACL|nr:hypothetical protein [Chengkuizengella sp. 2205SS18-9]MDP5276410.1 hypothetical protein [Chengkuizengella sp. 2205SS18-9]